MIRCGLRPLPFTVLDRPQDRSIQDLSGYWAQKRGTRAIPLRADIDPLDLTRHLASLFLLDVIESGRDFRYRLVGTMVTDMNERNVTGTTIRTEYSCPVTLRYVDAVLRRVVSEKRPRFTCGQVFWRPGKDHRGFEAGYFPISAHGCSVDMILAEVRFT